MNATHPDVLGPIPATGGRAACLDALPRRRRAFWVGMLLLPLWLVPGPLRAQDTGTPLGPVERSSADFLLTLPDEAVPVRYTPGSLDRAARLQYRLKALYDQLGKWTPVESRLTVFVLSPEEWQAQGIKRPYGLPARIAVFGGAAPAWGTEETVSLWRGLAGMSLDSGGEFTVRGSAEELATVLLADALLELEVCRMMAVNRGIAPSQGETWVGDLVGQILCTSARHLDKEPVAVDLTAVLRRFRERSGSEPSPSLASFSSDLEPAAWLAYQARFAEGAERVWLGEGKQAPKRLIKRWRRKGAPLSFEDLTALFPNLVEWRGREFPGG
ncbi:MAG: hypothetical protein KDD11_00210 [Acidobacteria bacterium]|nr:hypothetical protein [Acidobacteriota bacterium]